MSACDKANQATHDTKGNSIELPDVQSLSKSDVSPVPEDLQPLIEIGRPGEKTSNAENDDFRSGCWLVRALMYLSWP
ncbi:hypothetical protein J2Y86_001311 [Pseudomonas migulae]|nr:hypothetical protein [Pseudomonas migulae]